MAKSTGKPRTPAPTSETFDSIKAELAFAGDRDQIERVCLDVADYLRKGGFPKEFVEYVDIGRAPKKNFAQRFSTALAQKIADGLRKRGFDGVLPDAVGGGQETESRGGDAIYRIDVNFSTKQDGLALAVSVKTVNFRDGKTKRYTKNIRRADKELRAEAAEVHKRHPYAVLAAVILMPIDAAFDRAERKTKVDGLSSMKHAWSVFAHRAGRDSTNHEGALFEQVFIGAYQTERDKLGQVTLFDAAQTEPPNHGLPAAVLTFTEMLDRVCALYELRHPKKRR
jgi:hypothetical protein